VRTAGPRAELRDVRSAPTGKPSLRRQQAVLAPRPAQASEHDSGSPTASSLASDSRTPSLAAPTGIDGPKADKVLALTSPQE